MLSNKLFSSIGNTDRLYVDDVFSAYTYTGNGSTQTINNGIDLAGKGGLVWTKERSSNRDHSLFDTARGVTSKLHSNLTTGNYLAATEVTAFNSNGYSLGTSPQTNGTAQTYVSWTFRKAQKFFDVVTYTGDGTSSKTISHSLGSTPGMIVVKGISAATDWPVYHRMSNGGATPEQWYTRLNSTAAQTNAVANFGNVAPTSSVFTVGGDNNTSTINYIAYLFAHDTDADGMIQCGSLSTMPSAASLGWEPQFLLIKRTDSTSDWRIYDTMRNWINNTAPDSRLLANLSGAEQTLDDFGEPTATGFNVRNEASGTYIYLAIRRPNKPPTSGTQVYNAIARTGMGVNNTLIPNVGFSTDVAIFKDRSVVQEFYTQSRIVGAGGYLSLSSAEQEGATTGFVKEFGSTSVTVNANFAINGNGEPIINHFFRRAPGFFDVVCYTGWGAAQTLNHSLGVAPELVIVKGRQFADAWTVWHSALPNTDFLLLSLDNPAVNGGSTYWNNTSPTSNVFSVGSNNRTGASARPYVAYLFASLPGVSKVGSYVGNGASQTIDCGFASGARFILIKRTDSTGDWYVWDTARGIIAANDPHLSLNTTAAEVTTNDSVDPNSTGFIVNQVAATNINVTSSTYLYLAIA